MYYIQPKNSSKDKTMKLFGSVWNKNLLSSIWMKKLLLAGLSVVCPAVRRVHTIAVSDLKTISDVPLLNHCTRHAYMLELISVVSTVKLCLDNKNTKVRTVCCSSCDSYISSSSSSSSSGWRIILIIVLNRKFSIKSYTKINSLLALVLSQ